jgi:hypothetical protein
LSWGKRRLHLESKEGRTLGHIYVAGTFLLL